MSRLSALLCFVVALGCLAVPAPADEVADVEAKLAKAHESLKSFTANIKTTQDMDFGGGNSSKSTSQGTYEWTRQDGLVMYRMDTTGTSVQNFGGQETKTDARMTVISDGKYIYTISDQNGEKSAMKGKAEPSAGGEVHYVFEMMRQAYTLAVLPDAEANGHDCYVIEATAKETEGNPMVKTVSYFSKELGMAVRTVSYDVTGKTTFTSDSTDIKQNAGISADRFVFNPPAGVQVFDLTGG